VLLSFASAVKLSGVTIGWRDTDSDISVLAFDPSAVGADPSINGKNYAYLSTHGWNLVGHYNGQSGSTDSNSDIAVNTAGASTSQLWLVGAYNPNFVSGPGSQNLGSPSMTLKDHVKILAFAATKKNGDVPEPSSSSLLLAAAGAMGLWWRRRKAA
jgi:hypothetical protein